MLAALTCSMERLFSILSLTCLAFLLSGSAVGGWPKLRREKNSVDGGIRDTERVCNPSSVLQDWRARETLTASPTRHESKKILTRRIGGVGRSIVAAGC